jgi:signal peptidase I
MSPELHVQNPESVSTGEGLVAPQNRIRSPGASITRQLAQYLAIVLLAVASYFLVSHFFLQSVKVVGISMFPTLQDSERYLLNRWVFYLRPPRRADVVVIRDPMDNGFSVKRVVAGAGDSVCVREGGVYVNGRQIEEPYLSPGTHTFAAPGRAEQRFRCDNDQYFVLGDNRNFSVDSRAYGPVPRKNILGLVIR